jgi:cytochrome c peroxidase
MPPNAPAVDNPSTPEKVALGKLLFHETGLSTDGASCASCHDLANYGQDGKAVPAGSGPGARNTPTAWNAWKQFAQGWDGRITTVEAIAQAAAGGARAHVAVDEAGLVAKIQGKPDLVAAFDKAFPGGAGVSAANFHLALGAFQRTLTTTSRWDTFVGGDSKALSNEEKLGYKTFLEVGCASCHMSSLFGGNMYQKLGVYKPYPGDDQGRAAITKSDADKFMFKVPSLLNVEKTAPYYHDGKVATLEEAVTNMAEIQLGKQLTAEQTAAIVTFLKALTGELPAAK